MKNRKSFIVILAVLAVVTTFVLVACNKGKNNTPTSGVTINIKQETQSVNLLDEVELDVSTENATEDVKWYSSDDTIATVNNGVVNALKPGMVTIIATVNGVSDSCTVQVLSSTEAPVLEVSRTQISIDKNGEYTVTVSVKWLDKDVTDRVNINWELGAGERDGIATVTQIGSGKAVVKGLAEGETNFYVSTTIGEIYVNQKIHVKVCDSSVRFESEDLEIGDNGKFLVKMTAIDGEGNLTSINLPSIHTYRGDEQVANATYTWYSSNDAVVKIENGKLFAQGAGIAEVYGIYEGYQFVITVSVARTIVYLEDVLTFDLSDLEETQLQTVISDPGKVYLSEAQIGVLQDGKVTLDASTLPTKTKDLGKREIKIDTDKASYILSANLYSMLIETPEELDAWHAHAYTNGDDGYYALGNNIYYNGVYSGSRNWDKSGYVWASPDNAGFKGIFDGNGYIIEGLTIESGYRGFITLLQAEGIIRNIAFINASYSGIGAYVCTWGCGRIENVYVHFAPNGSFGYVDKNSTFGGVFMSTDNTRNTVGKMTIKNCFVDASQTMLSHFMQSYIGGYMKKDRTTGTWDYSGEYARVNDVYVIGPKTLSDGSEAMLHYNEFVEGSANYALYASASEMMADSSVQALIAQWDSSFWGIKNGTPIPLKVMALGDLITVDTPSSSNYYTFEGTSTVYSGNDYTFTVSATNAEMADFVVIVNGETITPVGGVYTVENVQDALDIDIIHAYVEISGNNNPLITYNKDTNTWKVTRAVYASYEGVREHGSSYISKEYIEYMIAQGYTQVQFTIKPDGIFAVQACYKFNGKITAATTNGVAATVTVNLTVASELEFWVQNGSGSGSAIKDSDCYLLISELTFVK